MREKIIKVNTVDAAVDEILNDLKDTTRRENGIYFDGWDGLGASPVLRAVAKRLALKEPGRPPELEFEQVIHVDCSRWKNTRTVQREIAKQLELPSRVMEMFDRQEEEDDFNGVTDDSSRVAIEDVAEEMERSTQGRRFLLLLHNGGNEEIDISRIGLLLYGYLNSKVIWTFQGRFRMDPSMKDKVKRSNMTHLLLSASTYGRDPQELWSYLLHQEATEAASKHGIDPAIVVDCFLYMWLLHYNSRHPVGAGDLAAHACSYWVCDGLLREVRGGSIDEEAWRVGDALQGEMRLDMDYYRHELPPRLVRSAESMPHWTSPAYGFVPLSRGMLTHFDQLCVLKLSRCSFSFSSPPFASCQILRFLWLHHCQDLGSTAADKGEDATGSWACFKSLWVLDLRYTDWDLILSAEVMDLMAELRELNVMGAENWDMSHMRGRLRNIRKLRVTRCTCHGLDDSNLLSEMKSMELVEFSGNQFLQGMARLYGPAGSNSLETVVVHGCDGLKSITLSGCREVKKVLLKGKLGLLLELDLSGTRVKTLDLEQVDAPDLSRLILLGCQKLVSVKWPSKRPMLDVVRIDTTTSTSGSADGREEHPHPHPHQHGDRSLQQQKEEHFDKWQISVADARLLRSFPSFRDAAQPPQPGEPCVHVDVCPAAAPGHGDVQQLARSSSKYRDVSKVVPVAAMVMWDCPRIYMRPTLGCYVKVIRQAHGSSKYRDVLEDVRLPAAATVMWECPGIPPRWDDRWYLTVITQRRGSKLSDAMVLPPEICDVAISLHVYDDSSINRIPQPPQGSSWSKLRWCRVERCPDLHTVFPTAASVGDGMSRFCNLEMFWGSKLRRACYIWDDDVLPDIDCRKMVFLHLDNCPMLIHALPLSMDRPLTYNLETLEIVSCGHLREVFTLAGQRRQKDTVKAVRFRNLKHVHLHELPMLQHICRYRIYAPQLETINIRGCRSLRRLPAIGDDTKPPMVDCDKEWWDKLEWDGLKLRHHPSLYKPIHSPAEMKNAPS